ncbi:uncharacterized protein LOC133182628 [Saccostrea echinata]|uniref:uncharacterized protein LOC133182628 n=1 Tax=Saccostrea echinata TaxID=191078 RepID=UPI002A7F1B36|nr:uncharacterized protein LOC133182628 [Saccostrea echinata]
MEGLFIITLLFLSSLSVPLPKWVHRVKSCPEPNNITEWIEASKQLNCLYDLTSKKPEEQGMIYHCLASTYLNESVEFCGRSVPIAPGNCPIYNYMFSSNKAPSYYNCSKFLNGCPNKMIHSKEVYKHPDCLSINPEKKCFRADANCEKETKNKSALSITNQTGDTTLNDTVFIVGSLENETKPDEKKEHIVPERDMLWMLPVGGLIGVIITGIVVTITRRKKLIQFFKTIRMKKTRMVDNNDDATQVKLLPVIEMTNNNPTDNDSDTDNTASKGSDSAIATMDSDSEKNEDNCDPIALHEETEEKRRISNKVKERDEKRRANQKSCDIKIENEESKSGKAIRGLNAFTRFSCNKAFSDFLQDMSEDMSAETTRKMKELLKDRMCDPDPELDDVRTPKSLLEYMDNKFSLYNNVSILQAYALAIQPPDENMYKKCLQYSKSRNDEVFYFEKFKSQLKGYERVVFHIDCKNIASYNRGDLDTLQKDLATFLRAEPDDVILVGIQEGSIILTFMIRDKLIPTLRSIFCERNSWKYITYRMLILRHLTFRVFKVFITNEIVYEPADKQLRDVNPEMMLDKSSEGRDEKANADEDKSKKCTADVKEEHVDHERNLSMTSFLEELAGSITDDILASMKVVLKGIVDEGVMEGLNAQRLLNNLKEDFKIEYNICFLQWIFEKCSAHELSTKCSVFASKRQHLFPLIYFDSDLSEKEGDERHCIRVYVEKELEKCQTEVNDIRDLLAKELNVDSGEMVIVGLEKGSVTIVFRLLETPTTEFMSHISNETDEFLVHLSRKGVRRIKCGQRTINTEKVPEFIHLHLINTQEANTLKNVKTAFSTVLHKVKISMDKPKVFLRTKYKPKPTDIIANDSGILKRPFLLEEMEPMELLHDKQIRKTFGKTDITKILSGQSRKEKITTFLDTVETFPKQKRDELWKMVSEHMQCPKDPCKEKRSSIFVYKDQEALPSLEELLEEIDTSIMTETFAKIGNVPEEIQQKCNSASGESRRNRAEVFLNFIEGNHKKIFAEVWNHRQKYE